jgi:Mg-chelatase subunit ChlD
MEKDKNTIDDGQFFGDEDVWDHIPTETNYDANPEKIGTVDWHNGRPVLSFSSLCDKTKSIFTAVKGVNIKVTEEAGDNYIFKNGEDGYTINIPKDIKKGINRYTAFNHELGHYAFDSFNNQFGLHINEELNEIPMEHHDKAIEIYRTVFNILEDQRVESLMGKIYLGTGKRFKQGRKRLGQMKPEDHKAKDPLDALHCAREFRDDCVTRKFGEASKVIDKIALKDSDASIILAKHYIKTTVNPWLRKQLKNLDETAKKQQDMRKDNQEPITAKPQLNKVFKKSFMENRKSDHRELSDTNEVDEVDSCKKQVESSKNDMEGALKDSKTRANAKIGEIKDKIEEQARESRASGAVLTDEITEYKDEASFNMGYVSEVQPNMRIAKQMNKIFKLLQARNRPKLSDTGDSISIPDVIRRMSRGYGDIHIKQNYKDSLAICVSIDASGSMSGKSIKIARDMMGTLFKSIEGINGVSLKGVVWSGSEYNTAVTKIDNYKQVSRVETHGVFGGGTPTPQGVEFTLNTLKNMRGKRKLMIVLTDGYPNSYSNSTLSPEQMTRKQINQAIKDNVITLGIGVGMGKDRRTDENMGIMFGKKGFITTNDMEDTQMEVIKKFRDIVVRQMR